MNKLTIIQGVSGSGKSFTARQLAKENDGIIFSTDDFWGEEYNFDFKLLGKAHTWNQGRVEGAMVADHPYIIVDNTNTTPKEWKVYVDLGEKFGYNTLFQRPTSPWWEEISPRIKNGTFTDKDVDVFFKKNTHGVPFEVIKNMMGRFQYGE